MVKEMRTARYLIEWERLIMRLPSRYKELVTVCLYQKLKDEIADLDEKIMDNLFFFRISASDCNEHDTLFYLKSLDLDRRMGYELGTIYECTMRIRKERGIILWSRRNLWISSESCRKMRCTKTRTPGFRARGSHCDSD